MFSIFFFTNSSIMKFFKNLVILLLKFKWFILFHRSEYQESFFTILCDNLLYTWQWSCLCFYFSIEVTKIFHSWTFLEASICLFICAKLGHKTKVEIFTLNMSNTCWLIMVGNNNYEITPLMLLRGDVKAFSGFIKHGHFMVLCRKTWVPPYAENTKMAGANVWLPFSKS